MLEQYHLAAAKFVMGYPEPYKMVFSHREDVTLANPYGLPVRWVEAGRGGLGLVRLRRAPVLKLTWGSGFFVCETLFEVSDLRQPDKVYELP